MESLYLILFFLLNQKIKGDIKVGGNIYIRKSQMNNNSQKTSRLRTASSYSDTSSSENNTSDPEHESNPVKLRQSLQLKNLNNSDNNPRTRR